VSSANIFNKAAVRKKLIAQSGAIPTTEGGTPPATPKAKRGKAAATPKRTPANKRKADALVKDGNESGEQNGQDESDELNHVKRMEPVTPKVKAPPKPRAKRVKTEPVASQGEEDAAATNGVEATKAPKKTPKKATIKKGANAKSASPDADDQDHVDEDTIVVNAPNTAPSTPAKKAAAAKAAVAKKAAATAPAAASKAAGTADAGAAQSDREDTEPRGRTRTRSGSRGKTPSGASDSEGSTHGWTTKNKGRKTAAKAGVDVQPTIAEGDEEDMVV